MAANLDKPEHLETWRGGQCDLRLLRHPRLAEAAPELTLHPLVIRSAAVVAPSTLARDDEPRMSLETLPVFRRSRLGPAVELRLEIDMPPHDAPFQFGRVRCATDAVELEERLIVRPGARQMVTFPFPAFAAAVEMNLTLEVRGGATVRTRVRLQPERRWTFFYAFQTHLDLGWTARAAEVAESLARMVTRDAAGLCRQFAGNPPGERFVWTCECSAALQLAWERSEAAARQELQALVREQLLQSSVLPYSYHTSIMNRDLMARAIRQGFTFRREMGVEDCLDLSVAQQQDVPGHNWVLPDVLAAAGVRRAIIGHNWMVRGAQLPPLFRWRGPAGGEVVTLATTCCDYGRPAAVPHAPEDLRGLSANSPLGRALPGEAAFHVVCYGENRGPQQAAREIEALRSWNAQFAWPRLVVGGPKDYFAHIESHVDVGALPVVDREISDWWVDGPASTPRAMAQYRRTMFLLPQLEQKLAPATRREVEDNLLWHAEHTFGLNSILVKVRASRPGADLAHGFENYIGSWEDKERYAARAAALVGTDHRAVRDLSDDSARPAVAPDRDESASGAWQIRSNAQGITRLVDSTGHVWADDPAGGFGLVWQWLLPKEVGEWFLLDPPTAPHAGRRAMAVARVSQHPNGVRLEGRLDSPAGAIPHLTVDVLTEGDDLVIDAQLHNKAATAEAECLALRLPFAVAAPVYTVEVGGHLLRVDADQLPDANRDAHAANTGWLLTDPARAATLAVSSVEVFLWHFGGWRYCDFLRTTTPRTGEVFAHLFNNVWNTNFRCWIAGDLRYRLRLRPLGKLKPLAVLADLVQQELAKRPGVCSRSVTGDNCGAAA